MKKALSLVMALMMLISTMCVVPVMAAESDGSEKNPYYVANMMTMPSSVTIPAHGAVYYQYKAAVFNGWTIEAYGLTAISVDKVIYDTVDLWGQLAAPLKFDMMSAGIVGYINDTDEEVEVFLTHVMPVGTQSNPAQLVNGENAISIPTNIVTYYTTYVPITSGEYTFSVPNVEDFEVFVYLDDNLDEGEAYALVDGTLTVYLEQYISVYITLMATGMTGDAVVSVTPPALGSEDNPIHLTAEELENTYDWSAGDLYFWVEGMLAGNTLIITSVAGAEFTALVDGADYVSEGGVMTVVLEAYDWYIELILSSEVDNEVAFAIDFAEGTFENPIELVDGDNEIAIPKDGFYYYTYTAENDGLLVLTPTDATAFDLLDIAYEDAEYNYHYGYLSEGASSAILPVIAGQPVIISACGVLDEDTFITAAVNTTLNVAVKDWLMYNTFEGNGYEGDLEGWNSDSDLVLEEAAEDSNVASGFYSGELTTTNPYANMYKYVNVNAHTDYEVTFKAMASEESTLWVKFNDNWAPTDVAQADVKVGTEWAEYTVTIHSGDYTNLVLLFQHSGENLVTYWFDDIIITKGATTEPESPAIVYGDVDGNGRINNRDLAQIQQYITGWIDDINEAAADVDGNGRINNRDLAQIQQYITGWITELGPANP